MNKKLLILCLGLGLLQVSLSQGLPAKWDPPEKLLKKSIIGVDPIGIYQNLFSGHYGFIRNSGLTEYQLVFNHWDSIDDRFLIGTGIAFRKFPKGSTDGPFYGFGFNLSNVSMDKYNKIGYDDDEWEEKIPIDGSEDRYQSAKFRGWLYTPGLEAGFRFFWDNGFTITPKLSAEYNIGSSTIESILGDEIRYLTGFGSIVDYKLGIEISYMY